MLSQDGQRFAYRLAFGAYHDRVRISERAAINGSDTVAEIRMEVDSGGRERRTLVRVRHGFSGDT